MDKKGLKYDSPVDERDPDYQKVLVKIQKGIVRGSSFIYRVTDAAMDRDGDKDVLWIEDGKLREVSPVNSPAYRGTDVIVRSEDDEVIFRTYDQWKAQQETLKRREFLKTLKD